MKKRQQPAQIKLRVPRSQIKDVRAAARKAGTSINKEMVRRISENYSMRDQLDRIEAAIGRIAKCAENNSIG